MKPPRDINRIDPLLADFAKIWKKYPDMRFYQLLACIENGVKKDRFYQEDNILSGQIQDFKKLRGIN